MMAKFQIRCGEVPEEGLTQRIHGTTIPQTPRITVYINGVAIRVPNFLCLGHIVQQAVLWYLTRRDVLD